MYWISDIDKKFAEVSTLCRQISEKCDPSIAEEIEAFLHLSDKKDKFKQKSSCCERLNQS
jgi:hypothetical protein